MVKDARGHVLFASRPQTELTALLSPPSTTTTHDRISTRNTSLQPYLHYLQQISQPSLQPYLPILVTFHSCNTSMQPYAFPLLQTHLCRNDSASAQGSLPRSPPPRPSSSAPASILHPHRLHSSSSPPPFFILLRARLHSSSSPLPFFILTASILHPPPRPPPFFILTRPLFLEPASILSLPPLLSLPHRPSHLSPTHVIFQPSPSRFQALRVMADSPARTCHLTCHRPACRRRL